MIHFPEGQVSKYFDAFTAVKIRISVPVRSVAISPAYHLSYVQAGKDLVSPLGTLL